MDRKIFIFPVKLTTCRFGNLTQLIHTLATCVTIHTHNTKKLMKSGSVVLYTQKLGERLCYNGERKASVMRGNTLKAHQRCTFPAICFVFVFLLFFLLKPRPFLFNSSSICTRLDCHTQLPNNCLCPLLFLIIFCYLGYVAFPQYFVL